MRACAKDTRGHQPGAAVMVYGRGEAAGFESPAASCLSRVEKATIETGLSKI